MDGYGLVRGHARGEDGDHRAFLADALSRAVDVRITQDGIVHAKAALVHAQPGFQRLFAGSVRREWPHGCCFRDWQIARVWFPVHRPA